MLYETIPHKVHPTLVIDKAPPLPMIQSSVVRAYCIAFLVFPCDVFSFSSFSWLATLIVLLKYLKSCKLEYILQIWTLPLIYKLYCHPRLIWWAIMEKYDIFSFEIFFGHRKIASLPFVLTEHIHCFHHQRSFHLRLTLLLLLLPKPSNLLLVNLTSSLNLQLSAHLLYESLPTLASYYSLSFFILLLSWHQFSSVYSGCINTFCQRKRLSR